ncbi:MAG: hypothetical protein HLX51_02105 [Micrococcaceae bacterium]|nr:hypothetical protein [Micrococcaceae bacterium]
MGSPHFSVQAAMRIGENIVARGSDTLPLDYSVTAGLARREIRDELGFMVVYAGLDDSFIEVDATENAEKR